MNQENLEIFNANIIKWYEFKNADIVMQIGENSNITNELKKIFKKVIVIKNIEELDNLQENRFDYILIYGYEKYNCVVDKLFKYLNDYGKILIIGENELKINNWSKYSLENEAGVQRLENHHFKLNTLINLKRELLNNNYKMKVYYVFPNYKQTEIIVNEKMKIEKEHIEKYNPDIRENEIKVFDELKVLKTIIANNPELLDFFTNSYFIEVSKNEIDTDINYVSFNNCRKEKYRLATIIRDNVVEKIPLTECSKEHIDNMKKIINELQDDGIEILDYEKEGHICSKLVKNEKTLDRVLAEKYENLEEVTYILNSIKDILLKYSVNLNDKELNKNEIKKIYNIENDKLEKLHFLKKAYWDMVPKNCFYIDNKFLFFDQEWVNDYLPVEFIIYRSVINSYDLVRKIDVDKLLEMLNILDYKKCFEEVDNKLRNEIIDKNIYDLMYKKDNLKAIDNLINDNKSYKEENDKKDQYIKNLERYVEELKTDNTNKQKHIDDLENELNKKTKRRFFK